MTPKPIRTLLKSIVYLFTPKEGYITNYLTSNENGIALLLRNKHTLNREESRYVVFFSELLKFCKDIFEYSVEVNPHLDNYPLTSFYLRFGFLGFVRLYSDLTERELKSLREQPLSSPNPNSNNSLQPSSIEVISVAHSQFSVDQDRGDCQKDSPLPHP